MIWLFLLNFLVFFIGYSLRFLPQKIFPFVFSSKILLAQHFQIPGLSLCYFEWTALVLSIVFTLCYFCPRYRSLFSILGGLSILLFFNGILSFYLVTTVFCLFWIGRTVNLEHIPTEFRKFVVLWSLWAVWCVGIPWAGLVFIKEIDGIRLIFLHICALKIGTYLYDTLIKNRKFSLIHTWHFFLSPVHFFIIPSWIACPFPSQFKPIYQPLNNTKIMKWTMKKLSLAVSFFILSMTGSILYTYFTKEFLMRYSDYSNHPWISLIPTNILCGLLCFCYFIFIGTSLQSFYAVLGFKMTGKIFNKPYLIQNIFDFWNRFLIQTKEFILKLFVMPSFNFLRHHIRHTKAALGLSILIVFFIFDIPVHLLGVYSVWQASKPNVVIFQWYIALMSLFLFYYLCRLLPKSIQRLGETRTGKVLKTIFWMGIIAFFY